MSRRRFFVRSRRGHRFALSTLALLPFAGCSNSSDGNKTAGFSEDDPHIAEALFIDVDGGGPGEDDVIVLRFDTAVVIQGSSVGGIVTSSTKESLGAGAALEQSQPGSERVEILLGDGAHLIPGVSTLNIAASGEGVVSITSVETPARRAGPSKKDIVLLDVTASAPVLVEARFVDSDGNGAIGAGDRVVASFTKPIRVPPGAAVDDNFVLAVAGDNFGASPVLGAASSAPTNRSAQITLGSGAALTLDGTFVAGASSAGSPSGLTVAAGPDITDTVATAPNSLSPGVSTDVAAPAAVLFGDGREADAVLGTTDASASRLTAQGLDDPAGMDQFSGTITVENQTFTVDLLFVADRGNDRVLVFSNFPPGTFSAATWVLGKPDFRTATSSDPTAEDARQADGSNLSGPSDVAFDGLTNTLFVSDTGFHRVLVWQGLFTVNAAAGALTLRNGKAATFALGQATLGASHANRGLGAPTASSLSSPGGLAIDSGRLAVADTGNHRVLIFGSLPTSVSTLPSTVLGQSGFGAGLANRGGVPAADTLSAPRDVFLSSTISINGSTGALLVADTGNHRVLVYQAFAPAAGAAADVALGQADLVSGDPALAATRLHSPSGVTADPTTGRIYVADTGSHRVMTFNAGGALATGAAGVAIGQASAAVGDPNRGGAPSASTLNGPGEVEIGGTALIVADSLNHRILIYEGASLPIADVPATIVLGQSSFTGATPEARRLNQPSDALVVDGRLVVSDTANHRVLIYNTIPLSGDPDPDVVLGQADLFSTQANRGVTPDADTLDSPTSVATDGTRLVVADTGNNRVLIWSALPTATGTAADIILGQPNATGSQPNTGTAASARTFHSPEGVAIDSDRLIVADRDNHRVLIFTGLSAIAAFAEATSVLGQPRFDEVEPNRGESVRGDTMRSPRDVLVGKGRLYVADSGNHRVLVWNKVPSGSGSSADGLFGQSSSTTAVIAGASADSLVEPSGLAMDPGGEFLLVSDTAHNRVVFFDSVTGKSGSDRSASSVLGQPTLVTGSSKDPGPATLDSPRGLFFNGYELYAADAGTSRLTVYR